MPYTSMLSGHARATHARHTLPALRRMISMTLDAAEGDSHDFEARLRPRDKMRAASYQSPFRWCSNTGLMSRI